MVEDDSEDVIVPYEMTHGLVEVDLPSGETVMSAYLVAMEGESCLISHYLVR